MKKALEVAGTIAGHALNLITQLALLIASVTVYPVAKAWHAGRLSAERQAAGLDQFLALIGETANPAASDDQSSGGAYL